MAASDEAIESNPNLRVTLGTDYLINPDMHVGLANTPTKTDRLWMHAALVCEWTIRSDRVEDIRHENSNMIRHGRGCLPHLVTVTAERLPARLASIARGTGEVDATYQICYDAMAYAIKETGTSEQKDTWAEVTGQARLLDYADLAEALVVW
ncbi:hypothetical protein GCM10011591_13780 [Nocardia camponoti]|uniref:Uncharacterized protein n=1 Tax=Nocardia camponoti TaxID=1616106 RepID=A0A917QC61_9NOCA|nr:NgoMIV family type II restriction endonuclease [Nocardia camponoti]GGK43381.1 hypothetical protein GCM10011591_13780 [Nocardia camponoti]